MEGGLPLEEAEAERLKVNVIETIIKLRHFIKFREDCINYYKKLAVKDLKLKYTKGEITKKHYNK